MRPRLWFHTPVMNLCVFELFDLKFIPSSSNERVGLL